MDTMKNELANLPISEWLHQGINLKAQHLLIVYNGQEGEYKPVFVMLNENLEEKKNRYNEGLYRLAGDLRIN